MHINIQTLQQPRNILILLTLLSATLIISAFILEHSFGVLPCKMCWWQRYAHIAIFICATLGLATHQSHPRYLPLLSCYPIILLSCYGLTIALWQYAAQHGWLPFPASCTSEGLALEANATNLLEAMNQTKIIPCDKETFTIFGLSLAGWNIPAMLGVAATALKILLTK